jgi:diguanylate cyclase (GGDEF)-like protein
MRRRGFFPDTRRMLDSATLLFISALSIALCGAILLLSQTGANDGGSLRSWGASMLIGALGVAVAAAGRDVPWIFIGISNTCFLAARSVAWTGTRQFAGLRPQTALAVAGPLLWTATIPFQHALVWMAVACVIGAAYTAAAAIELWRMRDESLPSRVPALALLWTHAAVYGTRSLIALGGINAGPWAHVLLIAIITESLLHTVAMAILLLAMAKERMEVRTAAALQALALEDPLTGIGNRRRFDEHLDAETRRAHRDGAPLALLLIDVDHFKAFNDAFGHQAGDACLRLVAQSIASLARREGDLVARYGGEEFAVLLPHTDVAGAVDVAEAIRCAVRALQCCPAGADEAITVSIGVAATTPAQSGVPARHPHGGTRDNALVRMADEALYAAKRDGRDTVRSHWQTTLACPATV